MVSNKPTKLWDLYYNGKKVPDAQGVVFGILASKRKSLVLARTHRDELFNVKFHGL